MHHLLFIQLLKQKTESGYKQIYDVYASRLYSFILSVTKNKTQAEEIIHNTFLSIWDDAPVISLHHPDPFLFLVQKSARLIMNLEGSAEMKQNMVKVLKNLQREPRLTVIVPKASYRQVYSTETMPRPSA